MSPKPWSRRLLLVGLSAMAALAGFVAYPGCVSFPTASDSSVAASDSPQAQLYASATGFLARKKMRGELPGLAPGDAGKFTGTWLWYDRALYAGAHRLRFTFQYADGRPGKRFEVVYYRGWQLVPLSKETKPSTTKMTSSPIY